MTNLSGANLNNGAAVGPQGEGRDSPSTFPKYPAYKDSGVEWLGVVPENWKVSGIKFFTDLITGITPPSDDLDNYAEEGWPWVRPEDLNDSAKPVLASKFLTDQGWRFCRKVKRGSTLICCIGTIGKIGFVDSDVCTNQQITAVVPRGNGKFFFYAMQALKPAFDVSATGNVLRILNSERLGNVTMAVPDHGEAESIARFLDHETARIDALIEEQQRLIELLKEKRQAVISHAVTKGLDPTVPMKDSGVEWLGEVPAHWVLKRIKHVTLSFDQGWSPQCENQPVEDDMQPGVLKTGCVNGGIFRSDENKRLPDDLELVSSLTVHAGDLLVSRANTRELVGSAAVPTVSYPNLMISDKIFRVRVMKKEANSRFLAFYLGSPFARREIELSATGASSSMLNISQSAIADMLFPCPPVLDQERIVRHIVEETYRLLALAEQALRLKELLQERRSALISAAVTGKIDVRGWQPPASTQAPEPAVAEAV